MSNSWTNNNMTSLTIPSGATTGARITINENDDGAILIYDSLGVLIGAWSGTSGTDPATGAPYAEGLTVISDQSGIPAGTLNITSGIAADSPIIVMEGKPGVSSQPSAIGVSYHGSGAGSPYENLEIIGPASPASVDPNSSFAYLEMLSGGSTANSAAGALGFANLSGIINRLVWNQFGIDAEQTFKSGLVAGRIVQTDAIASASSLGAIHWGTYNITTDVNGDAVFDHGAAFTPTLGWLVGVQGAGSPFYQYAWFSNPFTSTTANANFKTSAGANYASATLPAFGIFVG
jgi:hypothetical protein